METGLNAAQKKFVELMTEDRIYTNEEMADLCGVDVRTVYRWKKNEKITKEIEAQADINLKSRIGHAYGVLTEILFSEESEDKHKLKALEIFLKTQGKMKDTAEVKNEITVKDADQAAAELDKLLNS